MLVNITERDIIPNCMDQFSTVYPRVTRGGIPRKMFESSEPAPVYSFKR